MEVNGYTRKVDELGRIAIPITVREHLGISPGDAFEFVTEEGRIFLARCTPKCLVCDSENEVQKVNRAYLCEGCREVVQGRIHNK